MSGNLCNRPLSRKVVRSTALEHSKVLKDEPGELVSLTVFNSKGTAQFIQIIDAKAVPADGPVPLLYPPIPIPANTLLTFEFQESLVASVGIVVTNSSTGTFSKTIGSADCAFHARII